MILLETLLVALSTYSALPMPQFTWNEKNMRYAICCFPMVGLLCGGGLWLWHWLCLRLGAEGILFAAGAAALPIGITGGIHMDGFMDTVDALSSHRPRERKLEILKDPSCGAFAVLYCGVYLLLQFGLFHTLWTEGRIALCLPVFVCSRALSGLCAVTMPNARKAGMLYAFTENAQQKKAAAVLLLTAMVGSGALPWLDLFGGGAALIFGLLALAYYRRMAQKQFGGVTGDTSGFFLQVCELSMMAGIWIGGAI